MTEPHLGGTYQQILAAARLAEREGLVSFARCDHYLSAGDPAPAATDAFATLAGLARETTGIRLCVLVTPITFRHPAVIAKSAVTIDEMSGGRFDLGVGAGWMELEHQAYGLPFPPVPERWDRFEEALDYLEAVFGDGPGSFEGRYYRLDADSRPKPTGIRIVIGGGGLRRTPTLAGRRADEYNLFVCPPDQARARIEVMRAAAGDRSVEATMMGTAVVGRSDTEYRGRLARAAARRGRTVGEMEDALARSGVLHGTSHQAAEMLAALGEAGVERYYLQWLDLADYDGLAATLDAVRA